MGLYVYGICGGGGEALPELRGILDQPAYRFEAGSVCAIVSDCTLEVVRAERKHIAASQRVVSAVNAQSIDLLPMAFGSVTATEDELRDFLENQSETLTAQLQRIAGAVEMSLRLTLDVADPVAYVVDHSPELQAARAQTFGGRRPPSHDARIRLGQMFDAALTRYREASTEKLVAVLGTVCAEVLPLPLRDAKETANLALLVQRGDLGRFDTAVETAAAELDDAHVVAVGGPWAPHNFVTFQARE